MSGPAARGQPRAPARMTRLVPLIFPFRRLAVWLGALVLAVVVLALLTSGLVAVRLLESRLLDARVGDAVRAARSSGPTVGELLAASPYRAEEIGRSAGELTGTSVAIYRVLDRGALLPWTGAAEQAGADPLAREVAGAATGAIASGIVVRGDVRVAEAATVVDGGWVVVFQRQAADVRGTVSVVRDRLVIAGLVAVGVAVLLGGLAAYLLAQRIRRLDRAALRIARGDLSAPIADAGRDEVAQLAASFEEMRRRLARTDAARREFIQNASHELRTPLFAMAGYLELLEDDPEDVAHRGEFLAAIGDQVRRLTRLASDLLDLSRLDADRLELAREPVALGAVAATVASDFRVLARERGSRVEAAAGDALAEGDPPRVAQIAQALVQNALRHNPPGTRVALQATLDGERAVLEVRDDGPAIPDADRARIFDRFERASGGEGSGLGLAIARELAQRMDGEVDLVHDAAGKAFRLVLPRASEEGP